MEKSNAKTVRDESHFEEISWHDNALYGLALDIGNGKSNLVLDIDHIVKWDCGSKEQAKFWIASATLAFKNVTDLSMDLDSGDGRFQTGLSEMVIVNIQRRRIEQQLVCLGRPYYQWTIDVSLPGPEGKIQFGASGFAQTLRSEPVLCEEQHLPFARRVPLGEIRQRP